MNNAVMGIGKKTKKIAGREDIALESIKIALEDSNLKFKQRDFLNSGLFVGTTFNNFFLRKEFYQDYKSGGIRKVEPYKFVKTLVSYLSCDLSIKLNIKKVATTFCSGSSSGLDAFSQAILFLKRNKKNKAFVLELDENFNRKKSFQTSVCFILENHSIVNSEKAYGKNLMISQYFESKGKNQGLVKALRRILNNSCRDITKIDYIISSGIPGTDRHFLERDVLSLFGDISKLNFFNLDCKTKKSSPLIQIFKFLSKKNKINLLNKENLKVIFLNLGDNTNSSCMFLEV